MLIFLVEESLRVNNYIINFLGGVGKVPINNEEERKILDLVESVTDFSFRTTEKYYEMDNDFSTIELRWTQPNKNKSFNNLLPL